MKDAFKIIGAEIKKATEEDGKLELDDEYAIVFPDGVVIVSMEKDNEGKTKVGIKVLAGEPRVSKEKLNLTEECD